jgi:glycogen debranching enzyme
MAVGRASTGRVSLRARAQHRLLYSGTSSLVTAPDGTIDATIGTGFYTAGTRMLSRLEWCCDGERFDAFAFSPVGHDAALLYAQPPKSDALGKKAPYTEVAALQAEISLFVGQGLRVQTRLLNYSYTEAKFALQLRLDADFAGTAEAVAGQRKQEAPVTRRLDASRRELRFDYQQDGLERATLVRIERGADAVSDDGECLHLPVTVPPRGDHLVEFVVLAHANGETKPAPRPDFEGPTELHLLTRRLADAMTQLEVPDADVAETWATAVSDLAALPLGVPEGPAAPIAGLPLYQQFFGRDVLTTGWQSLLATPEILRDALRATAAHVGQRIDDWRDEEPGKMLHQAGSSPLADLARNPFGAYYGDYATPVDFVAMLGQYYLWTDDLTTARELMPAAKKALSWLERYADLDGDGLVEYRKRSPKGVRNQGWKDSKDAIVDEHGNVLNDPIASCELQGYYHAALRSITPLIAATGDRVHAFRLLRRAKQLRKTIDARLWLDDEGVYALGVGPDGQLLRSVTSNAGHMLTTAIPTPGQAKRVAARLMAADMFSGWGIRTLAASHPSYHPFSYHLGSVWPVEQATIAAGFGRYGLVEHLHTLARGFFDLAALFDDHRIPESVGGVTRDTTHPHPGIYPKADAPQAWSASAVVLMIQALLGIRPLAPFGLVAVDPHLPEWLPSLTLRNVRLGHRAGDLHFWRDGHGKTQFSAKTCGVRVVRVKGLPQFRRRGEA